MDLDEFVKEQDDRQVAHSRAKKLMGDASEILWETELGPLGPEYGHDAFFEFPKWRLAHADASLGTCMRWILASWDLSSFDASILSEETIRQQLDERTPQSEGFYQKVFVLDETILATALAQLVYEGGIDADARPIVALALARQRHPLVLARLFDENYFRDCRDERSCALDEVERIVAAAVDTTAAARRAHVKRLRRATKDEAETPVEPQLLCSWPAGTIVTRRLPTGTRLLLHLLHLNVYGGGRAIYPTFRVLAWSAEALPSNEEIDAMQPADTWTFAISPASWDPLVPAEYRSMLESTFELTGLTKAPAPCIPVSQIARARLDEYLGYNYDPLHAVTAGSE